MGVKTFKAHFHINHYVQLTTSGLCIGSGYVHNLVTIDTKSGMVHQNSTFSRFLKETYPQLLEATPNQILELLDAEDQFSESIPIYTYEGGDIIEKFCEVPEWPHTTHDGCMIYENTFSTDKNKVIGWAKRNARLAIENTLERITETEKKLASYQEELATNKADQDKLESMYPSSSG